MNGKTIRSLPDVIQVNVLLYRNEDVWIAQGLEYDIVAQGQTIPQVRARFYVTIMTHCHFDATNNREILQGIEKAPEKFWTMFEEAEDAQLKRNHRRLVLDEWKTSLMPVVRANSRVCA